MNGYLASRDLLRVGAVLFVLFLGWRFLAEIAATALLLATGLLLAVALSGPVETLHRHKVPRPVASVLIALGAAFLLGLGGYLLLPVLADQARQLISAAPGAFSQLGERVENLAGRLGLSVGSLDPPSASTLAGWARRLLGGALGLFGSLASILLGLLVVVFVPLYLVAVPGPVVAGWSGSSLPAAGTGHCFGRDRLTSTTLERSERSCINTSWSTSCPSPRRWANLR